MILHLYVRARQLVCTLNEFEARRHGLRDKPVPSWPVWAQKEHSDIYDAFTELLKSVTPNKDKS
jgi:hypothetical protein